MGNFEIPTDVHDHVVDQLLGKSWGDLEVLEHAGYLLFPDKIFKRNSKGGFDETEILLRIPRQNEIRQARVEARKIAAEEELDPKLDPDLFADLDDLCVLAKSIRTKDGDYHEPVEEDPRKLEKRFDKKSLQQVWAKIEALSAVVDPAPDSISEPEMIALANALLKEGNLSPLLVYGPGAQTSFVATTAALLVSSLESKSSSEQSEPSTPESSVSTDS